MSNKSSKFCSHCGTAVNSDDVFCNNCGASLDETIEPIASKPIQQQQPYTQPTYTQHGSVYVQKPSSLDNVAVLALVFGIISVVMHLIPFVYFFTTVSGIVAIITGAISMQRTQKKYLAIAGIVLGAAGIILWILGMVLGFRLYAFWW